MMTTERLTGSALDAAAIAYGLHVAGDLDDVEEAHVVEPSPEGRARIDQTIREARTPPRERPTFGGPSVRG